MTAVPLDSPKHQFIAILQQPEDSSHDELLRELAFARMVDRGLKDVKAGRVISNEEVKRRFTSWRE